LAERFHYYTRVPDDGGDDLGEQKEFLIPEEEIVVLASLLYKMFLYDPKKRITAAEVVEHPWFAKP
jgi:serine/threonine protein kinase